MRYRCWEHDAERQTLRLSAAPVCTTPLSHRAENRRYLERNPGAALAYMRGVTRRPAAESDGVR